jgi:hypothetical protein
MQLPASARSGGPLLHRIREPASTAVDASYLRERRPQRGEPAPQPLLNHEAAIDGRLRSDVTGLTELPHRRSDCPQQDSDAR